MAKARILVVDDAKPIVMVVETNLKLAGYEVLTACDGEEGLRRARESKPDCMILDVMMPEMNGWQVLEQVRADPLIADMQVIMLTALDEDADVSRGYELGVDLYLSKPFEPKELVEFVDRVVEMGRDARLGDD